LLDDERLKNPPGPGVPDYFDEMLERIRDIRASEKRMYLQVRDIFALAADYQPDAAETQQFFQIIQNKLHWAATGKTAAELIAERVDQTKPNMPLHNSQDVKCPPLKKGGRGDLGRLEIFTRPKSPSIPLFQRGKWCAGVSTCEWFIGMKPNMCLTSWKGAKVRKTDVTIAKNYLREGEIQELNRIVAMYLDYAEDQARRRQMLYMRDWREKLDAFLRFNEREILTNSGKVAKEVADRLALEHYEKFAARRLTAEAQADEHAFEAAVKKLPAKPPRKKSDSTKKPKKS